MTRRKQVVRWVHDNAHARWDVVPALLYPLRASRGRATPITYRMLGRVGRLGNQLFQIAGALAVAAERGAPVLLPDWRYRPYFSVPDEVFARHERELLGARDAFRFADCIESRHERIFLQHHSLPESVRPEVLRWFHPSALAAEAMEGQLPIGHLTALHVRTWFRPAEVAAAAVDGTPWGGLTLNPTYVNLTPEYYIDGARSVAVPGTTFVIFSDAPAWCRTEIAPSLAGLGDVVVVEGNSDWLDLFLMARCNRHVISNSTYAWWGAFLSDDPEPVRPSRVLTDPTNRRHDRLFPPSWRVVDV